MLLISVMWRRIFPIRHYPTTTPTLGSNLAVLREERKEGVQIVLRLRTAEKTVKFVREPVECLAPLGSRLAMWGSWLHFFWRSNTKNHQSGTERIGIHRHQPRPVLLSLATDYLVLFVVAIKLLS